MHDYKYDEITDLKADIEQLKNVLSHARHYLIKAQQDGINSCEDCVLPLSAFLKNTAWITAKFEK